MSKNICSKGCLHCKHLHYRFADAPHAIYMAYTCDVLPENERPLEDSLKRMADFISEEVNR